MKRVCQDVLFLVIFTARCICIVQTLLWHDVCLLHAGILSKQLNISSNFHYRVATRFHFLLYQTLSQYSDGDPLMGVLDASGYEIVAIFDQYLTLSRKRYNIE